MSNGRFGDFGKASVVLCVISWHTLKNSYYLCVQMGFFRRPFSFAEVSTIDTCSSATMEAWGGGGGGGS